ncbi:putative metallopeptidase [Geobacter sp.]|uniref:putative metallopeptidase n=1 Tax=Geobacter sp. TaxID=46610 RepID=UPI0026240D5C|nr:putative metallopeptidase [Geobacter sp.]
MTPAAAPAPGVLNLTRELETVVAHIVRSVEELSHIDPGRVLLCVSSTRSGGVGGMYAKIHPLRFPGGMRSSEHRRGRHTYVSTMPTVVHRDAEILYVIYFLLPRFFDLPLREKLVTIFHELYHISPAFDGDIRRFPGRNFAHGSSTRRYNAHMARLVDAYLAAHDTPSLLSFMEGTMAELRTRHRVLVGRRLPVPRIRTERR